MNLTHVYGCIPISAPSHVHPDQHAMAYMIPTSGTDSGNALLFFANDGGLYRSLNGFSFGPDSGTCAARNEFEDLNQNLGSMTQFVSFSHHPTDPNTLLGGTEGLPQGAQCLFSPSAPQVPGKSAVDVVMSISTAAASANLAAPHEKPLFLYAIWLLVPGIIVAGGLGTPRRKRIMRLVFAVMAWSFLIFLISCAGVSSGGGGGGGNQNPVSYQITVTGTSPGTATDPEQSTVVTLVVD